MLMDFNSSRCCSFNRISVGTAVELVSFYLVCCGARRKERRALRSSIVNCVVCD